MKTFTFVGSEMSSKNRAVKQLVQLWCCFVFSSSGASASCRSNGIFPHPSDCGKFFSCTPWGPVLMHCPAGLHFNPQLHICDWPNRAGCLDKEHSTEKCPIYRHPTDCAKFYVCAPLGHLLLHCPFGLMFNPVISVCDWPANVQCPTNQVQATFNSTPPTEETTALAQTEMSNEATNAATEESKEETTHELLLSATEASAENPSLTTEVQEVSTAVTEESKEETTHELLLSATEASAENPSLTTEVQEFSTAVTEESKEETTAVTEEWKEETTPEQPRATEASTDNSSLTTEIDEFSTTTEEETEKSKVETTVSNEAQTETSTSTWNYPSTEAEASLVTTERASSSASGEAAMFTIDAASTAVDGEEAAEAATTEMVSPTTTA